MVSNFMENKAQADISRFGGQMLQAPSISVNDQAPGILNSKFALKLKHNLQLWALPLSMTAMLGTITYPLAVKVARSKRLLKLRNFYAIHASIAPFLAFIHINFFSFVQTIIRIKQTESEYRRLMKSYEQDYLDLVLCQSKQTTPGGEPYGLSFYQIQRECRELDEAINA